MKKENRFEIKMVKKPSEGFFQKVFGAFYASKYVVTKSKKKKVE